MNDELRNPILLPGVEFDDALPIGSLSMQAVIAAEVDEVQDVLLETATTESRPRHKELGADT